MSETDVTEQDDTIDIGQLECPQVECDEPVVHFGPENEDQTSHLLQESMQDLELWLGEIELLLQSDCGKNSASIESNWEKLLLLIDDIKAHENCVNDLPLENDPDQGQQISERRNLIRERYEEVKKLAHYRRKKLCVFLGEIRFFRDIEVEKSWVKEKILLVSSDDYGQNLLEVQNLRSKHLRIETELSSHEQRVWLVMYEGKELLRSPQTGLHEGLIKKYMDNLDKSWDQIRKLTAHRQKRLEQSEKFHKFLGAVEEEEAWMNEKKQILESDSYGDNSIEVGKMLKTHDNFLLDLELCEKRVTDLVSRGDQMIGNGNHYGTQITEKCDQLRSRLRNIKEVAEKRLAKLRDNSEYLQFMGKCDVVESWITEKKQEIDSEEYGEDLPSVKILLTKEEAFRAGLNSFVRKGIQRITELAVQLGHAKSHMLPVIMERQSSVLKQWNELFSQSDARKEELLKNADAMTLSIQEKLD